MPLGVCQVGLFKVESSGFEEPKGGFNRPAFSVQFEDFLQVMSIGNQEDGIAFFRTMTDQVETEVSVDNGGWIKSRAAFGHSLNKGCQMPQAAIVQLDARVTSDADDKI